MLIVLTTNLLASAELPPAGGYKITEIGLTGPSYERLHNGKFVRNTTPAGLNELGHAVGWTTRYSASGASLGSDTWFFNGVSTQTIGLTGSTYQYTAAGGTHRSGYVASLNEVDQAIGATRRYDATGATLGFDAWIYNGSTTQILGLFGTGYQYASTGGTHRSNSVYRLNNAGQALGSATRFTTSGTEVGSDTWLFDGQITQLISLTGPGYEYATSGGVRRSSGYIALNQIGNAIGTAARYSSSGADLGGDAWLYDGTTTNVIGLSGAEYEFATSGGTYRSNSPLRLNNAGKVTGIANRHGSGGLPSHDAWFYNGAATQRIGLINGVYLGGTSTSRSDPRAISDAGFVVGDSDRYQYGPQSQVLNAGQDAWLFNGDTSRLIGLTDSEHQYVGQYGTTRWSSAGIVNNNSQAVGTSLRYSASGASLGQDAWLANDLTTVPLGLTGNGYEYSSNGGTYRSSVAQALNEAGHAIGRNYRYDSAGADRGYAGWFYDAATGVTSPLEFSVSITGQSYTNPRILTDGGVVLGEYSLYNGSTPSSRTFWWSKEAGFHDLGALVTGGLSAAGWESLITVTNGTTGVIGGSTQFLYGDGLRTGQATPEYPYFDIGYSAYLLTALPGLPGDFNNDGRVDTADYIVWRKSGSPGDYNTWRTHYGSAQPIAAGRSVSIPETGMFSLLALVIAIGALNRRVLCSSITTGINRRVNSPARRVFFSGILLVASASTNSAQAVEGRLFQWQSDGARPRPPAGNDFTAIAAGSLYHVALRSDGSLLGWGSLLNPEYELNVNVPAGNDFVAVAAGYSHALALRSDGSLVAWGYSDYGDTEVPAGNFTAISSAAVVPWGSFNLALRSDGSLVGWGRSDPQYLSAISSAGNDFVDISAGAGYSLALKSDGSIIGWLWNGQQWNVPAGNDFVDIEAGPNCALALKSDGSLVAWGGGLYGLTNVPAGNDFTAIAAGVEYALALRSDGTLAAWGSGLDNANFDFRGNDFLAIALGDSDAIAIRSPLPGSSQNNPVLPNGTTPPTDGPTVDPNGTVRDKDGNVIIPGFTGEGSISIGDPFVFENVPPTTRGTWIDPPSTFGYVFEMTSASLFTAIVNFPTGFDDSFEVWVNGDSLGTYGAGDQVDFLQLLGVGVASFAVTGINPAVDGTDPLAFPIQIAFDTDFASLTMTPLSIAIPEPVSFYLLGLGMLFICFGRKRSG